MTKAARECLIIFTRYPEPGKTKTRLIPLLGAEGAARFQRQMTEQTLAQVKELKAFRPLSVEVHFAGGNQQLMQDWLGSNTTRDTSPPTPSSLKLRLQGEGSITPPFPSREGGGMGGLGLSYPSSIGLGSDIIYRQQSEGDLGRRMALAFKDSFSAGMTSVVIIGTDCPDLKAKLMVKAFHALEQNDLVLGPALDGGYYLIGLRRLIPELFTGISWSTAEVLEQTIRIAERLDLAIAFLPLLNDIDRPEDLIGQTVDGYQVEG
jgi:glycosyltransferase A (GT-A) superfamily protein (DUF2064 family)